jgi:hypothetical protein
MEKVTAIAAILLLATALVPMGGWSQDAMTAPARLPLTLGTDMVSFMQPSSRFFIGWQDNAIGGLQRGFDAVNDLYRPRGLPGALYRVGVLGVFSAAGLLVGQAFSLTAHDAAHMEAARAIGATNVGLVRATDMAPMDIWEFFLASFNFTEEPGLYTWSKGTATAREEAYVAGEGLDTNMVIAARIAARIDEGEGRIMDLGPYLLNKAWGINYFIVTGPTSDSQNYLGLLQAQGYGAVAAEKVIALNAAAFLLSGGFLALSRAAIDFAVQGEPAVRPLRLDIGDFSVHWPELTAWLNPDNISLLVMLGAGWQDWLHVRMGVDAPVAGNIGAGVELTLGARVRALPWLLLGAEVSSRFVGVPFFSGTVEFSMTEALSAGIELRYGQGATMREVREYPVGPGAVLFARLRL